MMLKSLLLTALIVQAMSHKYADHFHATHDGMMVINESRPLVEHGTEYYWLGNYSPTFGLPVVCTIESSSDDWIFGRVLNEHGDEIRGLQFGCPRKTWCRGVTCYSSSRFISEVCLVISVAIMILYAFILLAASFNLPPLVYVRHFFLAPPTPAKSVGMVNVYVQQPSERKPAYPPILA